MITNSDYAVEIVAKGAITIAPGKVKVPHGKYQVETYLKSRKPITVIRTINGIDYSDFNFNNTRKADLVRVTFDDGENKQVIEVKVYFYNPSD